MCGSVYRYKGCKLKLTSELTRVVLCILGILMAHGSDSACPSRTTLDPDDVPDWLVPKATCTGTSCRVFCQGVTTIPPPLNIPSDATELRFAGDPILAILANSFVQWPRLILHSVSKEMHHLKLHVFW